MLEKNPSKRLGATELLKKYFDNKNIMNLPNSIQVKFEKNEINHNTLGL